MRYVLIKMSSETFIVDEDDKEIVFKPGETYLLKEQEGLEWPMIYIDELKTWFDYCCIVWDEKNVVTDDIYHKIGDVIKLIDVIEPKVDVEDVDNDFWDMIRDVYNVMIKYDYHPNANDLVKVISSII